MIPEGFQLIADDEVIQFGDWIEGDVSHGWADLTRGIKAGDIYKKYGERVYRKIPVAKQGDLDGQQSAGCVGGVGIQDGGVAKAVVTQPYGHMLKTMEAMNNGQQSAKTSAENAPDPRLIGLAEDIRKDCNRLTKEERDAAFAAGMKTIYSGIPTDAAARKNIPVATGFLDYFTLAVLEIAKVSKAGNEQHHPGQPLHWDRSKSTDEADACIRHFLQRGTLDTDGQRHTAKAAWRLLALLQKELEADANASKVL